MFESDKFIECVHAVPTLWDPRVQGYEDRAARDRAWLQLARQMYADEWAAAAVDQDEADRKAKELKNKWRNIRDNYLKYINQCSHGASRTKKRKYLYADKLTFLQDTIGKRRVVIRQEDTFENEYATQNDDNDEYNYHDGEYVDYADEDISAKMVLVPEATEPAAPMCLLDMPDTSFTSQTPSTEYNSQQANGMTPFQISVIKKLDALKNPDEEDLDKYFLMSILPDYRRLSDEEKLDFRINCLHFFRDVKNKQSQNKQLKRKL